MASSAISAQGVSLSIDGTTIAQVTNISGVEITRKTLDVTAHDSTGGYPEFILGMRDTAEITIDMWFKAGDTSGQIALKTALEDGTTDNYILTFPDDITATWTFTAIVTSFKTGDFPLDGVLPASATLKISGVPTFANTASGGLTALTGIEENTGAALTFTPAFGAAIYDYNITINTASTWIKLTPTAAAHTITIHSSDDDATQTVATTVQSAAINVTDGVITTVTLRCWETGKTAKTYVFNVYTP